MADFDVFREHLAITYPSYGHALWGPSPRNPNKHVQVGDVGFIRKGNFHRLFNALLSADDPSQEFGVPEHHEPLVPTLSDHIHTDSLDRNNYCSPGVSVEPDSGYHSDPDDPRQVSFRCPGTRGAVLYLPVAARREDTLAQGDFSQWIVKHIDNSFTFARELGLGIQQMEEIILVTGCDLTRSWTNTAFLTERVDAQVSFEVRVEGTRNTTINFQFSPGNAQGAVFRQGPEGTNLPENQCVFVRGFRVARTFWKLPRRLKAAAGPSEHDDQAGYDPDAEVISIPASTKYRDPLHILLDYIAEQASDCDMVLAHDNALVMVDGLGHNTSLESLEPDVMVGLLRRSKIEIHKDSYDVSPTNSGPNSGKSVVKVAMLPMTSQNWNTHAHGTCTDSESMALSNSNLQHIFSVALESNRKRTEKNLTSHPPPPRLDTMSLWSDAENVARQRANDIGTTPVKGLATIPGADEGIKTMVNDEKVHGVQDTTWGGGTRYVDNKQGVMTMIIEDRLQGGPRPVPENLCELRGIAADISHATDQSHYVSAHIKASLRECSRLLEDECVKLEHLTQLAHRATRDASNVLRWRIHFFDALDYRILELSQLRAKFVDSRQVFREQPNNLLAEEIRDARSRIHTGMLSSVKPLFDKIDKYYNEVNVSLLVEEESIRKIRSSLSVTPDDKRRWEHIRDACNEASNLLTAGAPLPPPHTPQSMSKATRNISVLVQTVSEARQSLQQANRDTTALTQHPQSGLQRLQSEYEDSKVKCQQGIGEVLEFSEHFLRSFVEIPSLDDFRDQLLPSAAESSSRIMQEVHGQMKSNADAVLRALPQHKGHFARFEHCFPIADASMQRMYYTLRGLVQPLEQSDTPPRGVLRTMEPEQLRNMQRNWRDLEEQWAAQLQL